MFQMVFNSCHFVVGLYNLYKKSSVTKTNIFFAIYLALCSNSKTNKNKVVILTIYSHSILSGLFANELLTILFIFVISAFIKH